MRPLAFIILAALAAAPAHAAHKPRKHHPAPRAPKAQPAPAYDPSGIPPSTILGGRRAPRAQTQTYTLWYSHLTTQRDIQRGDN